MAEPFGQDASGTYVILMQIPGLRGLKTQVGIVSLTGRAGCMSAGMTELFERALPVLQSVPRCMQLACLYPPKKASLPPHLVPRRSRLNKPDFSGPFSIGWSLLIY